MISSYISALIILESRIVMKVSMNVLPLEATPRSCD